MQEENTNYFNEANNQGKVSPVFYIILGVLFILLSVVAFMYIDQRKKTDEIIARMNETTQEKENLTVELDNLLNEYTSLQTDNDSLNLQMQLEQEKIKQMLNEVRQVKATNVALIAQYKNELATLRKIMRGYIVQIDSLNTLNIHLMDENVKVKQQFNKVQQDYVSLSEKTETLSTKVQIASVIKAENIVAVALNDRSKEVNKTKKVDKFRVCMTLDENPIAKPGLKDVYLRIHRPDDFVLTSSSEDLFAFQGEQIAFSAMRQIEYQNVDIELCIYWQNNQELIDGSYFIEIYTEGNLIGSAELSLK